MILRFAHPVFLVLLLIPFSVALLIRFKHWSRSQSAFVYSDTRLLDRLPIGWRVRFRHLPDVLRFAAWVILILALARPQTGRSREVIRGQGVDMILALDISGSMAALDFAPDNRLQAAQSVIRDFISGREFDRIGLLVFAQESFQQVPPTLDYPILLSSLDQLQLAPQLGVPDGTAIGLGLASAGNMLRSSSAASRVIILLTDGANNAGGIGPLTAAQAVATLGMRVYTIGMGKIGFVPMPDGQLVESDVDESTLEAIAESAHGRYFRAQDLNTLQEVYAQIDRLERSDVERQVVVQWHDQALGLLGMSLLLLLLERLLRNTLFQGIP